MTLVGPLVRIEVDCGVPLLGVLTAVSAQELDLLSANKFLPALRLPRYTS